MNPALRLLRSARNRVAPVARSLGRRSRTLVNYATEVSMDLIRREDDPVHFVWWKTRNWGDALNPVLVERLSKRAARGWDIGVLHGKVKAGYGRGIAKHLVVGSTLGYSDRDVTVWGAGFMYPDERPIDRPHAVLAVRGPLSAARLRELGCASTTVFGDPALLCPDFFPPSPRVSHELAIVLHESEADCRWVGRFRKDERVKIVDIRSGIERVIRAITSCSHVASSSLHGLIVADAYGIPWSWIFLSPRIRKQAFKFHDYFLSTGRDGVEPLPVGDETSYSDLVRSTRREKFRLDLDPLRESCPFA